MHVSVLLVLISALAASVPETEPHPKPDGVGTASVWIGPDGQPLPFQTHQQIRDFLLTATVLKIQDIPVGVTKPRKVLLEKDGIQVNSCFKTVDIHKDKTILFLPEPNRRLHWRDCCKFECAAYELSLLLGLDNVPPVVEREIEDEDGVLQIWMENAMMERKRAKLDFQPPKPIYHEKQMDVLRVFDALVHNDDRNPTNILYDPDWKLWMLDHTRCFPRVSDLPKPNEVKRCERRLWEKLQKLDEEEVKKKLKPYLKKAELKALLKRRKKLIIQIQELIEQVGAEEVLYTLN